jgi:predicted nucleic acid-binding protein
MVVFDTSIMVDLSRKKKYALDLLESYPGKEQVATTIITKYEMLRGVPEQYVNFVSDLLKTFIIYDFNDAALVESVKLYRDLKKKGKLVNELDFIIAGIAIANDQVLITKDTDFLNLENNKITVISQE